MIFIHHLQKSNFTYFLKPFYLHKKVQKHYFIGDWLLILRIVLTYFNSVLLQVKIRQIKIFRIKISVKNRSPHLINDPPLPTLRIYFQSFPMSFHFEPPSPHFKKLRKNLHLSPLVTPSRIALQLSTVEQNVLFRRFAVMQKSVKMFH